jgi:hypothetical protein
MFCEEVFSLAMLSASALAIASSFAVLLLLSSCTANGS